MAFTHPLVRRLLFVALVLIAVAVIATVVALLASSGSSVAPPHRVA